MIQISNHSYIKISKTFGPGITNTEINLGGNSFGNRLIIDEGIRIVSAKIILADTDNAAVYVGKDNMWADDIRIRAGDGHQIFVANSSDDVLNYAKPIYIGNHVWLGESVKILKERK